MSLLDETQYLERRKFFDYERLLAADLNDAEEFHREMRWLHNSSLHQPGVGNGYKVTGAKGAREVRLGPGYALDANGREIVLVRETAVPVPPVANDGSGRPVLYYLAVSYPDDSQLAATEYRQGLCGSAGAVRLAERPTLCWVELGVDDASNPTTYKPRDTKLGALIENGMLIVLAMVGVFQCQLIDDVVGPWLAPRRSAQPPPLPYTGSGVQPKPFWNGAPLSDLMLTKDPTTPRWLLAPLSLQTKVTLPSTVAFGAIPRYLVRVAGDRVLGATPKADPKDESGLRKVFVEPAIDLLLDNKTDHLKFTISVSLMVWVKDDDTWKDARESFFLVKAGNSAGSLVPVDNPQANCDALAGVLQQRWTVVWVGIEG
jgi:hypothetical protein